MKFSTYFGLSSLVSAATVYYAFWTRGQFYYTVVFLTTNRVTMLIMGNMALTLTLGAGLLAKRTFLGQLRDVEVELLYESSRFAIMETCLALTIFREELSARVVTLFTALLFFKAFHWLARARVEHIEQTDTQSLPAHVRLVGLLLVLLFCDISIVNACILVLAEHRPSVLILFAFEFAILGVAAGGTLARYILHLADMRVDGAWQGKHSCLFFLEFTTEVLRFFFYLVFFGIIFLYYGMPLHIVRDLWVSYSTLRRRLQTYTRYRQLTANMNERFPSATEAELDNCERTCIICRDGMEEGKKLPCGHIFHFQCLRMWLQQQQTCPTCRADIPARAPSPPPRPARQPEAAPVSNASPRPSEPVLILDPGSSPTTPLLSGHRTLGGRAGSGLLADIVAVKVKVPSAPILEIPGPVEMGREVRRVALGTYMMVLEEQAVGGQQYLRVLDGWISDGDVERLLPPVAAAAAAAPASFTALSLPSAATAAAPPELNEEALVRQQLSLERQMMELRRQVQLLQQSRNQSAEGSEPPTPAEGGNETGDAGLRRRRQQEY